MHLPLYQKPNVPREQGYVFSYSMNIELLSLTQVLQVKKKKIDEQRKQKKLPFIFIETTIHLLLQGI